MRVLSSTILFVFLSFSCSQPNSKDSVLQPIERTGPDYNRKLAIALNLPDLRSSADSFEMRIWNKASMVDLSSLIVLRYVDNGWSLQNTFYWKQPLIDTNQPIILDSSVTYRRIPSISYSSLLDSIKSYSIATMPTQDSIPGFEDRTADGSTYVLEIGGRSGYRKLEYRNPQYYQDSFNQKFCELLGLLRRQARADVP